MASIPKGDPGALRDAARTLDAASDALRHHATTLGRDALGHLGAWRGIASLAHAAAAAGLAREVSISSPALERAATACERLADELEAAQEEARHLLAQMAEAETTIASLEQRRSEAAAEDAGTVKLAMMAIVDTRSHLGSLAAQLAATEETANAARRAAEAAFESVTAMAPMVASALAANTNLDLSALVDDPRLALLVDTIARAGSVSSPDELRAILNELSVHELQMVLEAAPGLTVLLIRTGLPATPPRGSPEAMLKAALDGSVDPAERIALIQRAFATMSHGDAMKLALLYPVVVGNLNGAPIGARIAANRVHITGERQRVLERIESLERELQDIRDAMTDSAPRMPTSRYVPPHMDELAAIYHALEEHRARLDVLTSFLEPIANPRYGYEAGAPRRIDRQFLVFDPRADGLAAELHGYIDARTKHVAVLVPGTGAELDGFARIARRGASFATYDPTGSLATISWLGYDAPDSVLRDAGFNNYADAGGPALRDFVAGLGLAENVNVTVVGHSYGGAVVGAAEREGMRADNVIHVASAGASVDDISGYPHSSRRFSLTAPGDFIERVQGVADAAPGDSGDNVGQGLDPDRIPGVVRLETGRVNTGDPSSEMLRGWDAHSQPFDEKESHAWRNIYSVMVGGEVYLYEEPRVTVRPGPLGPTVDVEYPMEDPSFDPDAKPLG